GDEAAIFSGDLFRMYSRYAERQRAAEASIDADPLVRQLREQFAAVVRDGTIEPLEAKA
ncbi:PCRF domain-containing protein, partial [Pseudomonas aeruginosa]|uniref:PCRF domain-containing protein n=1 Tax=Pseudomonas aeruginosa TaxID=287 RepID=UPI0034E065C8